MAPAHRKSGSGTSWGGAPAPHLQAGPRKMGSSGRVARKGRCGSARVAYTEPGRLHLRGDIARECLFSASVSPTCCSSC